MNSAKKYNQKTPIVFMNFLKEPSIFQTRKYFNRIIIISPLKVNTFLRIIFIFIKYELHLNFER